VFQHHLEPHLSPGLLVVPQPHVLAAADLSDSVLKQALVAQFGNLLGGEKSDDLEREEPDQLQAVEGITPGCQLQGLLISALCSTYLVASVRSPVANVAISEPSYFVDDLLDEESDAVRLVEIRVEVVELAILACRACHDLDLQAWIGDEHVAGWPVEL
jgi:hypothetical protein